MAWDDLTFLVTKYHFNLNTHTHTDKQTTHTDRHRRLTFKDTRGDYFLDALLKSLFIFFVGGGRAEKKRPGSPLIHFHSLKKMLTMTFARRDEIFPPIKICYI